MLRLSHLTHFALFAVSSVVAHQAYAHEVAGQQQYNMVSIQANASRQVSNDQMTAILSIEKTDKQPNELANQINQLMNFAQNTVKKYPTVKVKTGQQQTYPIYDSSNRKIKDWRATASVILESRDIPAMSKLVAELQQSFQLENISFSVSPQQRQKVEDELLTEVSQKFQQRAKLISQAWNKQHYDLVSFNVDFQNQIINYGDSVARVSSMKALSSPVEQTVSAGESTIMINAHGNIQLK